uniref:Uncharacterized protein n=1 Tax=Arundo donax TaxID=35708 RepID=A0A0A9DHE6_ARUDO
MDIIRHSYWHLKTSFDFILSAIYSFSTILPLINFATKDGLKTTLHYIALQALQVCNDDNQVNHGRSLVTTSGMPKPGSMVSRNTGACLYLGDGEKANLLSRRASTTFSSTIARFCPMQVRRPCPNGMYMCAGLHAAATPLANRSGWNQSSQNR